MLKYKQCKCAAITKILGLYVWHNHHDWFFFSWHIGLDCSVL